MISPLQKHGWTYALLFAGCLLICNPSYSKPVKLSEMEAIHLLAKKTNKDYGYLTWIKPDCIQYFTEETTANYFDFALHEDHGGPKGHCLGKADPLTWPVIDRFRVFRNGKKILWYYVPDGEYVPYEQGIKYRKKLSQNRQKQHG